MPSTQISNAPLMPGKKTLPSTDWKNNGQIVRHGVPWTDRQSKVQLDSETEPPPMFTATPSKAVAFSRVQKSQSHAYRMDGGIDPVRLLLSRLETWRLALKNLIALFKSIASVETKTFKGFIGASRVIDVPFKQSNGQFLEHGGIQNVWSSIRDYTAQHATLHHENASYLERAVIPALRAIKEDTKTMVNSIQKDKNLKSTSIYRSRMRVDKLIADLDHSIQYAQRSPHQAGNQADPFLLNLSVIHNVRELCDHENQLHDSILNLQKESGVFEMKIIENIRYIIKKYEEFRLKNKMEHQDFIGLVNSTFDRVKSNTEWDEFVRRHHYHLVMENSSYKTESSVEYPNQDSHYVRAVKIGPLEIKSGLMRSWTEGVYILTPAGFLHGYKTPKHFQTNPLNPSFSIFVPQTSVDDLDELTFEVVAEKKRSLGHNSSYVFRAPSTHEAREWLDSLLRISNQFKIVPLLEYDQQGGFSSTSRQRDLPALPPSILPQPGKPAIESKPSEKNVLEPVQEVPETYGVHETPESSATQQKWKAPDDDPRLEGEEDSHSFILRQPKHPDNYVPEVSTHIS
ncbi:hypothetical protein BY458DRAFT_536312 [Sporodiniella umbellata]|nr:hypothetical protein BY458DRAFT_536312 [Sporodiniella umbellata]